MNSFARARLAASKIMNSARHNSPCPCIVITLYSPAARSCRLLTTRGGGRIFSRIILYNMCGAARVWRPTVMNNTWLWNLHAGPRTTRLRPLTGPSYYGGQKFICAPPGGFRYARTILLLLLLLYIHSAQLLPPSPFFARRRRITL